MAQLKRPPTLSSVAKQQGIKTPDVRQSFQLLAELARQIREGVTK